MYQRKKRVLYSLRRTFRESPLNDIGKVSCDEQETLLNILKIDVGFETWLLVEKLEKQETLPVTTHSFLLCYRTFGGTVLQYVDVLSFTQFFSLVRNEFFSTVHIYVINT